MSLFLFYISSREKKNDFKNTLTINPVCITQFFNVTDGRMGGERSEQKFSDYAQTLNTCSSRQINVHKFPFFVFSGKKIDFKFEILNILIKKKTLEERPCFQGGPINL